MCPGAPAPTGPLRAPQQQPPQLQQPLKVQTAIVNVFATVRDKHKAILSNLTKDDFKIYEDGAEQKIAYFRREVDMPITLALLIDTSGSMSNILGAEQDAASSFGQPVRRKKDEGLRIGFDSEVKCPGD